MAGPVDNRTGFQRTLDQSLAQAVIERAQHPASGNPVARAWGYFTDDAAAQAKRAQDAHFAQLVGRDAPYLAEKLAANPKQLAAVQADPLSFARSYGSHAWIDHSPPVNPADLPPVAANAQAAVDAKTAANTQALAAAKVADDPAVRFDNLRTNALQAVLQDPRGFNLRQLMAIGQAAPPPRKPFSVKDTAGAEALNAAQSSYRLGLQAAGDNIPEQLKAYERYQRAASALAGVDPGKEELAAAMAAVREGQ